MATMSWTFIESESKENGASGPRLWSFTFWADGTSPATGIYMEAGVNCAKILLARKYGL